MAGTMQCKVHEWHNIKMNGKFTHQWYGNGLEWT